MKLPLDWILQEPIDMEHKEYVFLDYISKVDKDLDEFKLYPTFQELSLHLANLKSISDNLKRLDLKRYPEEIDDEILLDNIKYTNLIEFSNEDLKEIVKIAKNANEKLRDFFLIAKSIWSIVFDSVSIRQENKKLKITEKNYKKGYIFFNYKNENYLYSYHVKKITPKFNEKKCTFKLIKKGGDINYTDKLEKSIVFIGAFDDEFPLEGCLLSVLKRKVINYISQTIKLDELKEIKQSEEKK
jgi:hypothetical protein